MTRDVFVDNFARRLRFVLQKHERAIAAKIAMGEGPQVRVANDALDAAVVELAEFTYDAIEGKANAPVVDMGGGMGFG